VSAARAILLAPLTLALAACGPSLQRLDEAPLFRTEALELKVVRYHERVFLHFDGEIGVVQCRSAATRDLPAGRTHDAGWAVLGRVAALGSKDAASVAADARKDYLALPGGVLAWKGVVLMLSGDGCRSFVTWDPTRQVPERIDPVPKPDYCAPKGTGDCRYHDFFGDRMPAYSGIEAVAGGRIAFVVRSSAFKGGGAIKVTSEDFGRTWQAGEP